jgi:hypothetical protein
MKTVYLCGGINGLSDTECNLWRGQATRLLSTRYNVLNPMVRDARGKEIELYADVVVGDLRDIGSSDCLLVKADRPSWGTAMKIVYARQYGKIIVLFAALDNMSPWLRYHMDYRFPTLSEACEFLLRMADNLGGVAQW